ncbi:unnamed protein product [Fusarium langsethiae]|nr:unnamed protein product [Fusarium langsethiae]
MHLRKGQYRVQTALVSERRLSLLMFVARAARRRWLLLPRPLMLCESELRIALSQLQLGFGPAVRRVVPCLPCLRSALAGASLGDCWDEPNEARYERCNPGGSCTLKLRFAQGPTALKVKEIGNAAATILFSQVYPSGIPIAIQDPGRAGGIRRSSQSASI